MRIGCHLTITKGLDKAAAFAAGIGANTFQYFTRNPRGGAARRIGPEEIGRWRRSREEHDIYPVVGHLPYTVNLAATGGRPGDFAAMVVEEDLQRVGELEGEILVSHPGHYEADRETALRQITSLLEKSLELDVPNRPVLCLETMALQSREIGSLEDLGYILRALGFPAALGVCLDSAHLFAAGWDLRTRAGCDRLVDRLEAEVGLERVKCMHLNDSLVPMGSRKDRHAVLGRGELGETGISAIIVHPFLGRLPLLLETPVDKYEDYGPQLAFARSLVGEGSLA
ncbi:MAG: deoxyribonuclease IV [Clostridia bacterium]|nr:MAG: deoxyribonuclease IV [Clostridia bacterium]